MCFPVRNTQRLRKQRNMSILDEITKQRRVDVAAAKQHVTAQQLRDKIRETEAALGPALNVLDRLNAPVVSAQREETRAVPHKELTIDVTMC